MEALLAQCPCSGGYGEAHPLVLLVAAIGVWLLFRWIKFTWKNKEASFMNKFLKVAVIIALIVVVAVVMVLKQAKPKASETSSPVTSGQSGPKSGRADSAEPPVTLLPRLVDLGAGKCIPCKMMAPILEELKQTYAGHLRVDFIDVWENPDAGKEYGINIIPTQIFYDPAGKELFRHEGFFSKEDILAKWKEFGFDFTVATDAGNMPAFERWTPAKVDDRPKDQICYMCDGTINPKTTVMVKTEKGDVHLCSPHCYFIMYSCLTEDKTDFEAKVQVTDWATGQMIPALSASYLYGLDAQTGRPTIKAFANKEESGKEQQTAGGSLLSWAALQTKELANRCGFCDRSCYPEDAASVLVEGVSTWGCCSHCALGVAARTGKDIEVHERDRLTGEPIVVKTLNGSVASLEPPTAVAWFGQRKGLDNKTASAGCFHQGFFVKIENLKKWVEQNPYETGKLISIQQALADKMKLSPQQIQKACKIGECSPK